MNTTLLYRPCLFPLIISFAVVLTCTEARTLYQRQRGKGSSNTLQWHSRKLTELPSRHRIARHMSSSSSSGKGKGKSRGSHEGYLGCLGLSSDDLQQNWIFEGQAASCSYTYHSGKGKGKGRRKKWQWWKNDDDDDDDDDTSGSGSSGGSSGSGGNYGGDDDSQSSSSSGANGGGNDDNSSGGGNIDDGNGSDDNVGGGNGDNGGGNGDVDDGDVDNRDGDKDNYGNDSNAPYDGQQVSNEDFDNVDENDDDYYYVRDDDNGAAGSDDDAAAAGSDDDAAAAGSDDDDAEAGGGDDGAAGGNDGDDNDDDANNGGGGNGADDDGGGNDDMVDQQNIQGANGFDPYASFAIETCDTYENLWLWDLSLSCESDVSLDTCECTFAEELIEEGYMSCQTMARNCPSDCKICSTCAKIMGCSGSLSVDSVVAQSPFFILIAAVGVVCCGLTYCYARRRGRNSNSEMAAHLMMSDDDDYGEEPVWLAPDIPAPIPSDKEYGATQKVMSRQRPTNEPNVWLAPTIVPFDRQHQVPRTNQPETLLADHGDLNPDGADVLPSPSAASIYFDNEGAKVGGSLSIAGNSVGDDIQSIEQQPSALDDVPSYDGETDDAAVWLAPDAVEFQPSHDAALDPANDAGEGDNNQGKKNDEVWLAPVV